jgi:tetratricopeptide (TPR) repeat protein
LQIRSRAWLAKTLSELGAFAEGRRYGEDALRLAMRDGHGETPIIVHGCLGELFLVQGDLEHAVQMFDQDLMLCRASDNRDWLRSILADLGYAYALQGRLAEGQALLEEAISESLRTGARHAAYQLVWLSEICQRAGCDAEAWQHACQALDLARQQQTRGEEAYALYQLGALHAYTGPSHAEQAATHYQRALALAEELGMRPLVAHCYLGLGRLYGQTGHRVQACAALSAAIALYHAMDMTLWLSEAEAALVQGERQ